MKSKMLIVAALLITAQIFSQADNDQLVLGKYITGHSCSGMGIRNFIHIRLEVKYD